MSLITTYGASDADSYLSLADALTIAESLRLMPGIGVDFSGWDALVASPSNDAALEEALRMAATRMNTLAWIGDPYATEQALAWPLSLIHI